MTLKNNLLIEMMNKEKNSNVAKLNKKKNFVRFIMCILVIIFIAAIMFFIKVIKPEVEEYIKWLESPLVCIDPGHGGSQCGAWIGEHERCEKDDNLTLALKVRDILKDLNIRVIMTRDGDNNLSLDERCKIANDKHADIFVSIHRNKALKNEDNISGLEIWVSKRDLNDGEVLAQNVHERLIKEKQTRDRGIKYGSSTGENSDYFVNRNTNMPSILIEQGFITNKEDNRLYDENIDLYAKAIAYGIIETLFELYPDENISNIMLDEDINKVEN